LINRSVVANKNFALIGAGGYVAPKHMKAISAAFSWDITPISYHLTAAVSRMSFANSAGVFLSAENAPKGNVMFIVLVFIFPLSFQLL